MEQDLIRIMLESGIIYLGYGLIPAVTSKLILNRSKRIANHQTIVDIDFIQSKMNNKMDTVVDVSNRDTLVPYITILEKYLDDSDKRVMYNNIHSLEIGKIRFRFLFGVCGSYNSEKNRLRYFVQNNIGHEFLHMASSYYDSRKKVILSGFRQSYKGNSMGKGINEGYTELLASRFFNKDHKVRTYKKLVRLATLVEFFFDDPRDMQHLYFNHNLPGLVNHLSKYAKKEDVINILFKMDEIILLQGSPVVSPVLVADYIKTQITLYNWFMNSDFSVEKKNEFKKLICTDKMVKLLIDNWGIKLNRNSSYNNDNDDDIDHKSL